MGKCICLSRVSTGIQDLDQQTELLLKAAHESNYFDDDVIIIEDKESAVCKSEEERNGLNKLKEYVENGGIDIVIVYELSRIARRADVLYSVRDFLLQHKVQLQVMNPSFRLLKNDGTLDENSNILMGIFCSLSENEGYLRKARFKRGKAKLHAQGKFINGCPLYGYRVNEDMMLEINEPEAEVIQGVFNDYIYNNKTAKDIAIDLINKGIKNFSSLNSGIQFIYHLLHNCSYAGISTMEREMVKKTVTYEIHYPAIVTKEMYEKAIAMAGVRRKYNKVNTKHKYLLRGLLTDKTKKPYSVFTSHKTYCLISYEKDKTLKSEVKTKYIDSLVWDIVKNRKLYSFKDYNTVSISKIQSELSNIDSQINNIDFAIKDREEKIKRIEYRVVQGKLSFDDADSFEEPIKKDIQNLNDNRNDLEAHRTTLSKKLSNLSKQDYKVTEDDLNNLTFNEKEAIVREEVHSIILVPINNGHLCLCIGYNDCNDCEVYQMNRRTGSAKKLEHHDEL